MAILYPLQVNWLDNIVVKYILYKFADSFCGFLWLLTVYLVVKACNIQMVDHQKCLKDHKNAPEPQKEVSVHPPWLTTSQI